jgi:hypothetical protein
MMIALPPGPRIARHLQRSSYGKVDAFDDRLQY